VFDADVHFWVSYIGVMADKGTLTVDDVAAGLALHSSLKPAQARELIRALIAARKVEIRDGKLATVTS
jgi:hypothetical protein